MSQLSAISQTAISKIRTLLLLIQGFISRVRKILFQKIPNFATNFAYSLSALKDIASFLPAYLYKAIVALIICVLISRKLKKYLPSQEPEQHIVKSINQAIVHKSQIFGNLGEEFEVKQNLPDPQNCDIVSESDSYCQDLTQQLQQQSGDFRDVVFFQLMKGYRRSLKEEAKTRQRSLKESQ